MKEYKEHTCHMVEKAVCDAVNTVFTVMRPDMANNAHPEDIYRDKKNITLSKATARHFCLYALHDKYGFTYKDIASHTGMNEKAVMKCVRKVRNCIFIDTIYMEVNRIMTMKMEDGILWTT